MRRRLARRHRNFHAEQDGHDSDEKEKSSVIREADALQCLAWIGLGLHGFAWPGSRNGLGREERDQAGGDRFQLRSGRRLLGNRCDQRPHPLGRGFCRQLSQICGLAPRIEVQPRQRRKHSEQHPVFFVTYRGV